MLELTVTPWPAGHASNNSWDNPEEGYRPSNSQIAARLTRKNTCTYLFTIIKENNISHKWFKEDSFQQIQGKREYTTTFHTALKYKYMKEWIIIND